MKTKLFLALALVTFGVVTTACEGGNDNCVEHHMEEGLNQPEAEDKCNEELMETVEVL